MPAVKGSKQETMMVVPYRPRRILYLRLGVLGSLLLIAAATYFFGHYQGVLENGDARTERDLIRSELASTSNENVFLQQQLVNSEQAGLVDKQALDDVQDSILSYRETIAQLEEDVLFYKQIMSPENDETGLVIGLLDLVATGSENIIRYRLELKQQSNNDNLITGYANVNILGQQDSQEVSIPLRSLSVSEEQLDIRLQFRYFQNIEGELVLPENFVAERVQILAVAEGSGAKTVQKSFAWVLEI